MPIYYFYTFTTVRHSTLLILYMNAIFTYLETGVDITFQLPGFKFHVKGLYDV